MASKNNNNNSSEPPLWEKPEGPSLQGWLQQTLQKASASNNNSSNSSNKDNSSTSPEQLQQWFQNIWTTVKGISIKEETSMANSDDNNNNNDTTQQPSLDDPYNIWWITKFTSLPNNKLDQPIPELPDLIGARFSQLSTGAWLNAMTADKTVAMANPTKLQVLQHQKSQTSPDNSTTTTKDLLTAFHVATELHRSVQSTVQADIWRTTPARIQQHLAPDVTPDEFRSIRQRIYDTVVLGRGLHNNDDDDDDTAAVTMSQQLQQHDVEKYHKCPNCGNKEQSLFTLDRRNGDIICNNCGVVVAESLMHEGSAYRKFEGEADRNHHGDAANPLYSNARNMSTTLGGRVLGAAGVSGIDGMKGSSTTETIFKNIHAYTELNVSQFGSNNKDPVVQRAKELFAGFRDDRELVQQFKGVLAACLCEAFEELSQQRDARLLIKGVGAEQATQQQQEGEVTTALSARAQRRNDLHHATLAGKGGLLLDFSNVQSRAAEHEESKPAATWDLDDCRSWLLGASRRIAQQWVQERKEATSKEAAAKLPVGPLEELEGQLVEHSILLCEHLEQELQSRAQQRHKTNRVKTPRVNDMSKLGISWQHAHERGSGGKGGVGGSGTAPKRPLGKMSSGPTAGQILLMKTSKQLTLILKDQVAGEAIHKELRAVMSQQETRKRQKILEEASRQRMLQMKRKPWLQARAQDEKADED